MENSRQTHKDFLVFGGEGIVTIHQTPRAENGPVYIQRRDPVSSLYLVTPGPVEVENPAHFRITRESRPAEHTSPSRINALCTKPQIYGTAILQRMP